VWLPFVALSVSHWIEYGAVVSSAPRFDPSSLNCTPTTVPLSLAFAETVTLPLTFPADGAVRLTVGGVLSAVTDALASFDAALALPAASSAVTR
jgi:hypothetical protein